MSIPQIAIVKGKSGGSDKWFMVTNENGKHKVLHSWFANDDALESRDVIVTAFVHLSSRFTTAEACRILCRDLSAGARPEIFGLMASKLKRFGGNECGDPDVLATLRIELSDYADELEEWITRRIADNLVRAME